VKANLDIRESCVINILACYPFIRFNETVIHESHKFGVVYGCVLQGTTEVRRIIS
jgi:hypothetical protein